MPGRGAPLITACLIDGPLSGRRFAVAVVQGRPPKTIDLDGADNGQSRYCLAGWEQSGHSAEYTYLYEV